MIFAIFLTIVLLHLQQVDAYQTDKSPLYAKYPQLVSNTTDPCVRGLNQVLINMRTARTQEIMVASSVHALNDLGSYAQCDYGTIGEWATYSTLSFNLTHIPL